MGGLAVGRCRIGAVDLKYDLVFVAPPPVFAWLKGAHDGVLPVFVPVRCGVLVWRGIAAADVTADHAQSKMDPGIAGA